MTDILRVNFAHLDPAKQDEVRSKMYTAQFNRMVQMLDTDNPGVALDRMEGLLGLSDLSLTEKNAIRQNVISEKFPKAVVNKLEQQFVSAENELRTVTVSVDGKTQTSSDPRKAQLDMLRPAERGGTTRYMDLAARMLDNLGIKPGQPLSPLQANLQGSILETVTRAEAQAKQLQRQIDVKVDVGQKLRQGAALTGEEASKAWGGGWSMSAMGGDLQPEDPVYQALSAEYKRTTGKDIPWDAKAPLVLNDQTEQIGVMLAREDAESWRGNTATDMPAAIGDRVKSFISAGNPAQVKWALNFYQGLGPAGQERLAKSLGTGKEAVWTQAALVEGSRLAFSPRVNEQGSDFAAVVQKMRSITETMANDANARAAFSAGLRYEKTPKFDTDAAKALERALGLTPTQGGFGVSGTGASAPERLIELLGSDKENLASVYQRAYIVQSLNPGADLDTAMSQVVGEMRAQGYTVADSPRGKVLIQDPYSHANFDWEKYRALQNPGAVAPSMPDLWSALEGDQKYDIGMKRIMSTRVTDRALREYGAAIGATPEDIQWAKERGSRRDWLLYRVVSQQEAQQGTQGFPLPDSWAWSPAPMYGPEFEREMGMPDGGIPMILHAPGYRPMNQLYANGRPLHSFSARRLQDVDLALVNRNRIPDNHLTSSVLSRATIPMKDDSAARLQKMTEVADEMARKTPPIGTLDLNN
jgi:hypothetical protein